MVLKHRKRQWFDEEKRLISFQMTAAGVPLTQVVRRYAMNANLIFKWLRDARYTLKPDATAEEAEPILSR